MKEYFFKEIDLIQACVTRMAQNSFTVKGLALTCVSIVNAIIVGKCWFIKLVLLLPILVFWWLDAYYLHREKLYRRLYEWVVEQRLKGSDELLMDLNANRFKHEVVGFTTFMFRSPNLAFYGIIIVLSIFLSLV